MHEHPEISQNIKACAIYIKNGHIQYKYYISSINIKKYLNIYHNHLTSVQGGKKQDWNEWSKGALALSIDFIFKGYLDDITWAIKI